MSRHLWVRHHGNGALATATEHLNHRDVWFAGAPTSDAESPYRLIQGLAKAKTYADEVSGCSQPCDCPMWRAETLAE